MIEDRRKRQILRTSLIVLNILLALSFIAVMCIGIYSLRSKLIAETMQNNQYYVFDLDHLEQKDEEIRPDRSVVIDAPKQEAPKDGKVTPRMAILLTGLGLDRKSTQMSLVLPAPIGLGFFPYTSGMKELLHDAATRGHEVFLYLPFELGDSTNDPGMLTLLASNPPEQNTANLERLLAGFVGCTGVYGVSNEVLSSNMGAITPIADTIKQKNMLLVLGSSADSLDLLKKRYDNIITNAIVIDTTLDSATIRQNLQQLATLAKIHGKVLGYIQGYPMTVNLLNEWIPTLIEQGVELVPVSALSK